MKPELQTTLGRWVEVGRKNWIPTNIGEEIVGKILGSIDTPYGKGIKIATDTEILVINYTSIYDILFENIGKIVRIVYNGMVTSVLGRQYKKFRVYVERPYNSDKDQADPEGFGE